MAQAPIFEETYQDYIHQIDAIDYLARADLLGLDIDGGSLLIPLYNEWYRVSANGVESCGSREATPAVRVILCRYVLGCPMEAPPDPNRLMSFREFKNAAPLVSYFTSNTNKTIETHFSGKTAALKERAEILGGSCVANDSYDVSVRFAALPRIPVHLHFNDRDDLFPAACSVLYHASAQCYLDMECLAMTGTLLAGKLITQ